MHEHELIHRFFSDHSMHTLVQLGVGDDAAIIDTPPGHSWAISIDTLISGVHFPPETKPEDIGYKAIAVSISDMAAMGASPETALLALTLPDTNDTHWLKRFSEGFYEGLTTYGVALIGGDTTQGPCLSISTTVNGLVLQGQAIRRQGAKPGDRIYVTGPLGDAGYGLALWKAQQSNPYFYRALNHPKPRVKEGIALRGIASSAIDLSDGLATDLKKLCHASGVGAEIQLDALPLSAPLRKAVDQDTAIQLALSSGDDYELCFTASPDHKVDFPSIGVVTTQKGLKLRNANGEPYRLTNTGYEHFK